MTTDPGIGICPRRTSSRDRAGGLKEPAKFSSAAALPFSGFTLFLGYAARIAKPEPVRLTAEAIASPTSAKSAQRGAAADGLFLRGAKSIGGPERDSLMTKARKGLSGPQTDIWKITKTHNGFWC